jgi:hypothetical protein
MIQTQIVVVLVKFLMATHVGWNTFLITRNKKFIFNNHMHERLTQLISAGLLEFESGYSHLIYSFYSNVSG